MEAPELRGCALAGSVHFVPSSNAACSAKQTTLRVSAPILPPNGFTSMRALGVNVPVVTPL